MKEWILKVELNGEWEECIFPTRKEALTTFLALAEDYHCDLQRAILFAAGVRALQSSQQTRPGFSGPN